MSRRGTAENAAVIIAVTTVSTSLGHGNPLSFSYDCQFIIAQRSLPFQP